MNPSPFFERMLPARSQPLIAAGLALGLVAAAIWMARAGGFSGGLVEHDHPPRVAILFTLDINSAEAAELSQLPGVGPALARRMIDHRQAHGPFLTPEAILDVPGIGEATLDRIRPHLRPLTLNLAPGAAP
jgi:competence ComEA-like helix-hairpin-helix protein